MVYLHSDWSLEHCSKSTYLWQVTNFQVKTDDERVPADPDHKPHSILKKYTYEHMQNYIYEHIRDNVVLKKTMQRIHFQQQVQNVGIKHLTMIMNMPTSIRYL